MWTLDSSVERADSSAYTFDGNSPSSSVVLAATPTFSPAGGTYITAQTVTISCATAGATIYYAINGTPTTSSSVYTVPITVNASETVNAIAVASGYTNSSIGSVSYTITGIPAPTFSPAAGTYANYQTVTISASGNSSIYYTTDGTTPTTSSALYTSPFAVYGNTTVKAIAVSGGVSSSISSISYVVPGQFTPIPNIFPATTTAAAAVNSLNPVINAINDGSVNFSTTVSYGLTATVDSPSILGYAGGITNRINITPSASGFTLNGLLSANTTEVVQDGWSIIITNTSNAYTFSLGHAASATAANQFLCPGATALTIPIFGSVILTFNVALNGWTVVDAHANSLYSYGFKGDGVTDDSAAINAAIAAGGHVTFPARLHVKINSGITIKSGYTNVDFNGCWIDASSMTSGYALSLVQDPNPTTFPNTTGLYGLLTAANPISNLTLVGPNSNTNNTDGLFIGTLSGSGQVSGQTLSNVQIWGFRNGVYLGNNAYLISFYQFNISTCWQWGFTYYGNTNAGECLSWHGGRISNCNNGGAAFNPNTLTGACGIYMQPYGGGHNELFCHGVSFDYCDNSIVNYGGILTITGHNEDGKQTPDNPNPMIAIVGGSSQQATGVYLLGGTMSPTNLSPTTRPALVTIDAGNNPKTFFIATCRWTSYGNAATFVQQLNSLNTSYIPIVSLRGSVVDYNAPTAANFPTISPTLLNQLANPSFEGSESGAQTGSLVAWTQTPTTGTDGFTFSVITSPVQSGSYAAQIVATNATYSGSLSQKVPVNPGQQYNCRIWLDIAAITSGTVYGTVHFYSYDGTDLVGLNQIQYTVVTGGYIPVLLSGTVPKGACVASVQVYLGNCVATVNIDAVEFYSF